MRAMRRFAVSVMFSHSLTRPTTRGPATRGPATRGPATRATALATLGGVAALAAVIVLIAGTSAVLAAGTAPARAAVADAPRNTLASVIPSTAIPRSRVTFAVYCTSPTATSATLHGRMLGLTKRITMRPNAAAGDFTASVVLPGSIRPGTYHPRIACSDGTSATARLLVPAFATAGGASASVWLTAGGLILIAVGIVAGDIALRRRKRRHSRDSDGSGGSDGSAPPDPLVKLRQTL
jgi:hypothetical protein